MTEHAWWSAAALRATSDLVFPEGLADIVTGLDVPTST
jgi:hypothetical protein